MKKNITLTLTALALCALAAPAGAQQVYRCGDSYSQQPCLGGAPVKTDDARSASQRADTSAAAKRDAKSADTMEKARLKEEAKVTTNSAGYIPPPKVEVAPVETKPVMTKPKKPQYFTAVSGKPAPKKKPKAKKPATPA